MKTAAKSVRSTRYCNRSDFLGSQQPGHARTGGQERTGAGERTEGQKRHRTGQPKDRTRPCQSKSVCHASIIRNDAQSTVASGTRDWIEPLTDMRIPRLPAYTYGRPVCDAGDATFRGTFREFRGTFRERFASFTQGSTHVSRTFRGVSRMSPGQAICSLPRACGLPSTRKVCYLIFVHFN